MSSPVELSDLPVANLTLANDPSAIMLLRVGLTDYQVAVSIIRNINLQALQTLPNGTPIVTDLMLVNRIVSGTPTNFQVTFGSVGFPVGTRMWFYQSLPPTPNWNLVPNTGNSLLACADASADPYGTYNAQNGGVNTGTWQQTDHILTIDEIPSHNHSVPTFTADSEGNRQTGKVGSTTKSTGVTVFTSSIGGNQGHNHGNTWRPMANVGTIGIKVF